MKKLISVLTAVLLMLAFSAPSFAEGIELDPPIYDSYGLGEEIFICGTPPAGTITVRVVIADSNGELIHSQPVTPVDLMNGVYVAVNRAWPLGEYTLYLITERGETFEQVFEVVQDRVDHGGSTGGDKNHSVADVIATSITLSQTEMVLHLGETATVTAAGERASFKWSTDDTDKISISGENSSKATITPKKVGQATVWVYCGNNYATLTIDIVPADKTSVPTEPSDDKTTSKNEDSKPKDEAGETEPKEDKPAEQDDGADLFTDLGSVPWARESINALAKDGVLSGMGGGLFAPTENVSRAQFVQMITKAFGFTATGESSFSDVGDEWFAPAVLAAADNGIVNGYDGRFEPYASVTCQDAAVIVSRVLDMLEISLPLPLESSEDEAAEYAREAIGLLRANGIITDEMGFSPLSAAGRAQSACLIYGAYKLR